MFVRRAAIFSVLFGFVFGGILEAQNPSPSNAPSSPFSQTALLTLPPSDGPVVVQAGFQLLDINQIEDQAETFEFSGILTLRWKDSRQAFDPAAEGVAEKMYLGNFQFNELSPSWYPEVVLRNVAGLFEKAGVVFRVSPDGTCLLTQSVNAVAKTRLNLRRYPFDRQLLEAEFMVLGFNNKEVVMEALPMQEVNPSTIRIPQWNLKSISTIVRDTPASYLSDADMSSTMILQMEVRRYAMFIMRLVVMPLFLVVILSWSVFWMDRASLGDRMSVSFVGLLTVVAYQIVLGDILPHISYVTLINGFLNFSFFIMCATVVANLIVGSYDRSGNPEAGDRLDKVCRWAFPLAYALLLALALILAFTLY